MNESTKKSVYRPGLNLSPYMYDQDPNLGSYIDSSQIKMLLKKVQPYTDWVRFFGMINGLEHGTALAHEVGLKAAMGIWLSRDHNMNELQMEKAIEVVTLHKPEMVIVGSETLLRNDLKEEALIEYIQRIRSVLPKDILVTTADTFDKVLQPKLISAVDVVFANLYPFFTGVGVEQAMVVLDAQYKHLVRVCGGKEVIISETGWPSEGEKKGRAIPSLENAVRYFLEFASWAQARKVRHFYFEAFDEPWKKKYEGEIGAHFGLWDKDGVLKPGMQEIFDGKAVGNFV